MTVVRCQWPDCKVRNPPGKGQVLFENTRDLLDTVPLPKLLKVLKTNRLGLQVGFCQQHWDELDRRFGLKHAHAAHPQHEKE
jgi:hypothetical protein